MGGNCSKEAKAQVSELFPCNGSFINSNHDNFFIVSPNPGSGTFTRDLSLDINLDAERHPLNAIGFRWADQSIYGTVAIGLNTLEVFSLDKNETYQVLDTLNVISARRISAGAITNDQKFLVITELRETALAADPSLPTLLHKINLEDGSYTMTTLTTQTTGEFVGFAAGDIAFDPLTDICYGFDNFTSRLFTMNINTGEVDNSSFPELEIPFAISGLFFDPFGRLFGIDKNPDGVFLYELDKQTGRIISNLKANEAPGALVGQDGCSCPFTVAMEQTISPDTIVNCQEVEVTTHLAYWNEAEQSGLTFQNSFPPGCIVQEVVRNPYGGMVNGIGTNVLEIVDMAPTYGLDSIIVSLSIPETFPSGAYFCQANLSGFDSVTVNNGQATVYSDFRPTAERYDATPFSVSGLDDFTVKTDYTICPEEQLVLRPVENSTGLNYKWSNGSTDNQLTVEMPGEYRVTIGNGCGEKQYTIQVTASSLTIDLGEDRVIPYGATIQLKPEITSSSPVQDYRWSATDTMAINCFSCPENTVQPRSATTKIQVEITNSEGCLASDEIILRVERLIYAPTAFSPNGDGINDHFFLQAPQPIDLNYFRIFDRWGNLIFEDQGGTTNSIQGGWDGRAGGRSLPNGVYIWVASTNYQENTDLTIRGELLLVK